MSMQDGTYAARPGAASVYESPSGALVLSLAVKIDDGPEMKSFHTLINKDGAVNTRTVDNLKAWSGWDGTDPFWFMETDLSGVDIEVVIANEPGFQDPTKMFPKVKWVNPPGGGGGGEMHAPADKRTVLAKYGSKFRALAGGTPAAVRTAAPAAAPVRQQPPAKPALPQRALPQRAPPPPTRPVAAPAAPVTPAGSTQAAAWGKLCTLGANLDQAQKEAVWFACVDATGMDQADMTPAGWQKVGEGVEAHFSGLVPAGAPVDEDAPPF